MMKLMIKFDANWNDEFDCQQFVLLEGTWDDARAYVKEAKKGSSFGTNQEFLEEDFNEGNFEIIYLHPHEWDVLIDLFPRRNFGTGVL